MAFDEVETVNLIAGSYDLSLVVTGKTMNDVASFVSRRLSPLANVLSCQTNFILKNYKEGGVIMAETIEEEDKRSLVLLMDYSKVLNSKIVSVKPSGIRKFFDIAAGDGQCYFSFSR